MQRRPLRAMNALLMWIGALVLCACSDGVPSSTRNGLAVAALLGANADPAFARAEHPIEFEFPRDHTAHSDFQNEWWYVTGNLDATDGRRFGFQVTLFRFSVAPPPGVDTPARQSSWATRDVWMGHFAISDVASRQSRAHERFARGALGLAGTALEPARAYLESWSLVDVTPAGELPRFELNAEHDGESLTLNLESLKPIVLQGDRGLSTKGPEPGQASHYFSATRLRASGALTFDNRTYDVEGLAWLDREWSTSSMSENQIGWDWFALQLDDGCELMVYAMRLAQGGVDATSHGSFVDAAGAVTRLERDDFEIAALSTWTSDSSGASYPTRWQLDVPALELQLDVQAVFPSQELRASVTYWEGAVDARGRRGAADVSGRGYVELTGYARQGD